MEANLPLPKAAALARVQSAFADWKLPITSSAGDVVEGGATDNLLVIRHLATIIPLDNAHTGVVLPAFGRRPAMGPLMPELEAQVTSKSGALGPKAWARVVALHRALAADSGEVVRQESPE